MAEFFFSYIQWSVPTQTPTIKEIEKKSVRQYVQTQKIRTKGKKEKSQPQADEVNGNFLGKYFLVFVTNYH